MRNEEGSIFLASVFIMVILLVLSLSFASLSVSQTRISYNLETSTNALNYAQAGFDKAVWYTRFYPETWRGVFVNGVWFTGVPLNEGTFELLGTDTDGSLGDDPTDKVDFTARGYSGNAVRIISAEMQPRVHPSVTNAVFSASTIDLTGGVSIQGNVRANGNITTSGAFTIGGDVFTTIGSSVESDVPDGDTQVLYTTSQLLPQPDTQYFINRGEKLNLPLSGGVLTCQLCVLSPTSNPYGNLNSEGIYYVEATNKDVEFSEVSVYGTIIVKNATSLTITNAYQQVRVNPDYPAILMNRSNLYLNINKRLDEIFRNVDYNQDGDKLDSLKSSVSGVIYTPGSFSGPGTGEIWGCVIANSLDLTGTGIILHDITLNTDKIVGFLGGLELVAGTYKEVY